MSTFLYVRLIEIGHWKALPRIYREMNSIVFPSTRNQPFGIPGFLSKLFWNRIRIRPSSAQIRHHGFLFVGPAVKHFAGNILLCWHRLVSKYLFDFSIPLSRNTGGGEVSPTMFTEACTGQGDRPYDPHPLEARGFFAGGFLFYMGLFIFLVFNKK